MTPKKYKIYVLIDPFSHEIRYVGQTSRSLSARLVSHCQPSSLRRVCYRTSWIKKVLRKGGKPIIVMVQSYDVDCLDDAEIFWISEFRSRGCKLVNGTDGGGGCRGYHFTEQQRMDMSRAKGGTRVVDQHGNRYDSISVASERTGISTSDIHATLSGKCFASNGWRFRREGEPFVSCASEFGSDEHRARISKARGGRKFSDSLGNVFLTTGEAAAYHSTSAAQVWSALNGRINSVADVQFSYLDSPAAPKAMKMGSPEWGAHVSRCKGGRPFRDQNGVRYNTKPEAAKATGISVKSIQRILNGEYGHVRGYSFEYCAEVAE